MLRFRHQDGNTAKDSRPSEPPQSGFMRWLPIAALAAGLAVAPFPDNDFCLDDVNPSFRSAQMCPALRQSYLDMKAKDWKSGCVCAIVYDPRNDRAVRELTDMSRRYRIFKNKGEFEIHITFSVGVACSVALAHVLIPTAAMGRREKAVIYICPESFETSESRLDEVVSIHETTHACDRFRGITIKGRRFTHEELEKMEEQTLQSIKEARASGNVLRRRKPAEWDAET